MTGLKRDDLTLGTGAHLRVIGKGRRERCTPLAKATRSVLNAWLREPQRGEDNILFPNARGGRLSIHGVQYILNKHRGVAAAGCPSLMGKSTSRSTASDIRWRWTCYKRASIDLPLRLWLGHQHIQTTQIYLDATLAMKERALEKVTPHQGQPSRYRPDDRLLTFLKNL